MDHGLVVMHDNMGWCVFNKYYYIQVLMYSPQSTVSALRFLATECFWGIYWLWLAANDILPASLLIQCVIFMQCWSIYSVQLVDEELTCQLYEYWLVRCWAWIKYHLTVRIQVASSVSWRKEIQASAEQVYWNFLENFLHRMMMVRFSQSVVFGILPWHTQMTRSLLIWEYLNAWLHSYGRA